MTEMWRSVAAVRAELAAGRVAPTTALARAFDAGNAAQVATLLALEPAERVAILRRGTKTMHADTFRLVSDAGTAAEPERLALLADLAAVPTLDPDLAGRFVSRLVQPWHGTWADGVTPAWARACVAAALPFGERYPAIYRAAARALLLLGDREGVLEAVTAGCRHPGEFADLHTDSLLAPMWAEPRYAVLFAEVGPPAFTGAAALAASEVVRVWRCWTAVPDVTEPMTRMVDLEKAELSCDLVTDRMLRWLAALPKLTSVELQGRWTGTSAAAVDALFSTATLTSSFGIGVGRDRRYLDVSATRAIRDVLAGQDAGARLVHLALCFGTDPEVVAGASVGDLVLALDSPDPVVRARALTELETRLADVPVPLGEGGQVVVLGRLATSRADLAGRLAGVGVRIGRTVGKATRAVVVGERHGGAAVAVLDSGVPVVTEARLLAAIEVVAPPALAAAGPAPEVADRLRQLLGSPDESNLRLALDLMGSGGVPGGMLEELLVVSRCTWLDRSVRDGARRLLVREAPGPLREALRQVGAPLKIERGKRPWSPKPTDSDPYPRTWPDHRSLREQVGSLAERSAGAIDPATVLLLACRYLGQTEVVLGVKGLRELPGAVFDAGDTVALDVSGYGVRLAALPDAVGRLAGLRQLRLVGVGLAELSPAIGDLAALENLHVPRNELGRLPAGIGRLAGLRALDLAHNRLAELPAEVGGLASLECLNLSANRFTRFPPAVLGLLSLTWLDLSAKWGEDTYRLDGLPADLGRLATLRGLVLRSQHLGGLPESMRAMSALRSLDLAYATVDTLPDWLAELPALVRVDVGQLAVTDRVAPARVLALLRERGVDVRGELRRTPAPTSHR